MFLTWIPKFGLCETCLRINESNVSAIDKGLMNRKTKKKYAKLFLVNVNLPMFFHF